MFIEKLKRILGLTHTPAENPYEEVPGTSRPSAPQVFSGRSNVSTPDFALNVSPAELPEACKENVVCTFICRITRHRIYGGKKKKPGQNVSETFEGITANCDAIKEFGATIAEEDGFSGAYRYVDLNHIYECCCGDPGNCRFYNKAMDYRKATEPGR